ncbi:MAG: molybdopterin-dependent oxidoreductase [Pseudomonadota bacterium]
MEDKVRTLCQGCHSECGVYVHVENGKVVRITADPDHPWSRGYLCAKGRAQYEWLYHPDRLRYPMRRAGKKAGGAWERISWDRALTEIADKLTDIKDTYGNESIGYYHGTGPRTTLFSGGAFLSALGSPNDISTDLHICLAPTMLGEHLTYGASVMMERGPDYEDSKCILLVGGNPLASHPPRGREILAAKRKNGAKLIVVDPRRIPLAAEADLWLQILPGTDGALAMAILHVIIEEKLYDEEFVQKWCHGFDELRERVKAFSPEKAAAITWIPPEKIRAAAGMFATTRPACLHKRVAADQSINSIQTTRALASMIALTGNLDVKGGNLLYSGPGFAPYRPSPEVEEKRIGRNVFPLAAGKQAPFSFVHAGLAADAMLSGTPYPLKALYCAGGNPVMCMQNSKKMWQALKTLDLCVVADFFMTPTAELADYVLPAAFWIEKDELSNQLRCISARRKIIEPLFECKDDREILIELVKRIPWADRQYLPWGSVEEWNESAVKNHGMTFEELNRKKYISFPKKYDTYIDAGFRTPTGKVELYATVLEKQGVDPLPHYHEPPQSPLSTPELWKAYPLVLISGSRDIEYYASMGREIAPLRNRIPDPLIQIHPDTADSLNIKEGDWVWVETPQMAGERVRFKATLTFDIDPRVVHAAFGWWFPEKPAPEHGRFESNINVILSDGPPMEPVIGSVAVRGTLCKIYRHETNFGSRLPGPGSERR